MIIDGSGRHSIDEISHPGGDARFQADDLTRFGRAEEFYSSQSCELEIADPFQGGIRLGYSPRELSGGFQKEHPREQCLSRKVARQKGFIAAYLVLANTAFAWLQTHEPIQKSEFGAVGKAVKGGGEEIGHWMLREEGGFVGLSRGRVWRG